MGEAKRKKQVEQYSKQELLRRHPWCCYCGAPASTVDHCPPRALFFDRKWPEGYDFPACEACNCNAETRNDEQLVAVLFKVWSARSFTASQLAYWQRQVRGLRNTQPALIKEMLERGSRNDQRRGFREMFGKERGDELRRRGFGMANVGDSTRQAINRFGLKLSKALFYRHTGHILDGKVWFLHFSAVGQGPIDALLHEMLRIAPMRAEVSRGRASLADQFIYQFNVSQGPTPILYAVVQFTDQMLFQIVAASQAFLDAVGTEFRDHPGERMDARLKR